MRTKQEKLSLLNELYRMADADGNAQLVEYDLIFAVGKQLGLAHEEIEHALATEVEFTPPKDEFPRIVWLQSLAMVMIIDRQLVPAEVELLKQLGLRLGLNTLGTEALIEQLVNEPGQPLEPTQLLGLFKTYHN